MECRPAVAFLNETGEAGEIPLLLDALLEALVVDAKATTGTEPRAKFLVPITWRARPSLRMVSLSRRAEPTIGWSCQGSFATSEAIRFPA